MLYEGFTLDYVRELDNRKYNGGIHLSEIDCLRKMYLKELGYREVPDPESIFNFKVGTALHEICQQTLINNGFVDAANIERKVRSSIYKLDSSADVAWVVLDGKETLLDFKTIKCAAHKNDMYGFENLTKAQKKHIDQATGYAHFIMEENPEINITQLGIVYIKKCGGKWLKPPKDKLLDSEFYASLAENSPYKLVFSPQRRNFSFKTFYVPYDPITAKLLVKQRIAKYDYYSSNKIMPPKDNDAPCNLCTLSQVCEQFE